MEWLTVTTVLALVEYLWVGGRVGMARGRYEIAAPATTGHPVFERHYRVQQNTIEQLVVFLPALWMFGTLVDARVAAVLGVVFVIGRVMYALAYVAEPSKRSTGFLVGYLANAVLVVGSGVGAIMALV
jgi:uncharacterized MAPEG superfamily protein